VLAAPVDAVKGIPHFRDITFENIRADGAGVAFDVNASASAPLENFTWKNVDLEAQRAGSIRHTLDWKFEGVRVKAVDGGPVLMEDMRGTQGSIRLGR
jgi:hypothetical protein